MFVHPEEILDEVYGTETGTKGINYLFNCLECKGKASFLPEITSGKCLKCGIKYNLHSCYWEKGEEIIELFESSGFHRVKSSGGILCKTHKDISNEKPIIKELSKEAFDYLESRGIDRTFTELFQLKEASYKDRKWLALETMGGNYELREISGNRKSSPGGKNISIIYDGGYPYPKIFVCEGMISAMSYAQMNNLTYSDLLIYVLNSVINKEKLIEILKGCEISSITLALDNDKTGRESADYLKNELESIGWYVRAEFPEGVNDWNDILCQQGVSENEFIK